MPNSDPSYDSRIQKLEEELTFLDDYVAKQDQEILELQKKHERIIKELRELREHFDSGALNLNTNNEKPPHY